MALNFGVMLEIFQQKFFVKQIKHVGAIEESMLDRAHRLTSRKPSRAKN